MSTFPAVVPHLWLPNRHLARPPWQITLWFEGRAEAWFGCWYASRYELEMRLLMAATDRLHCSCVSPKLHQVSFSVTDGSVTAWFRYQEGEWVFEEYFPEDESRNIS